MDPAKPVNPAKTHATLHKSELNRDRLAAALPNLQARYEQACASEYAAEWSEEYERVEKERDALAEELTKTYPVVVKQLVSLFERIDEFDKEIARINGSAPREKTAVCSVPS